MTDESKTSRDELLDDLENDPEWEKLREQRILQMKREYMQQQQLAASGHGKYSEITVEKEFLEITTKTKRVICHFSHRDFTRCKIVDKHLEILAKKHIQTKFIKVDVENAPFFVEKLQIKILPCIICFLDGVVQDRIVGFDELGSTDNFKTNVLEQRLAKTNIIRLHNTDEEPNKKKSILGYVTKKEDDSDDD